MSDNDTTDEGNDYFNASLLVDALKGEGLEAHVWQSGGGTATIYIKLDRQCEDGDDYFLLGPGSYHWNDPGKSLFTTDELYYGEDASYHDEAKSWTVEPGTSIPDMAKQIADAYRTVNKMEDGK